MLNEQQILEIVEAWKNRIKESKLRDRRITDTLKSFIGKEVVDIVGVRRSGKSSSLFLLINRLKLDYSHFLYVNFEDPLFIGHYDAELLEKIWNVYKEHSLPGKKPYLFLDEIQLIPRWELWARKMRDLEAAHIFVTGSSSMLMSREFGTKLTGRHISVTVFPLSFEEFLDFKGIKADKKNIYSMKHIIKNKLNEYLMSGGFPEYALTNNRELLKNYFEDILYKDIILRHDIRDAKSLRNLAVFCMTNVSNYISYNSLRKQFSLSLDTVKSYLSDMEESFLVFAVPIFSYSLKAQENSPKKIYCIDNGLRNAVSFKFSRDMGKLAENAVFLELKRRNLDIYYWKGKNEVDLVVKNRDNSLTAINVSYSEELDEREIKGLKGFKGEFSKAKKLMIITKDTEKKEGSIRLIPLWRWLLVDDPL